MIIYHLTYQRFFEKEEAYFLKKEEALKCFYKICKKIKDDGWYSFGECTPLYKGNIHSRHFISVKKPGLHLQHYHHITVYLDQIEFNVVDNHEEFLNDCVFYENPIRKEKK